MDNAIPRSLIAFVRTAIASAEILLVIVWATPLFSAVLVPLMIGYLLMLVIIQHPLCHPLDELTPHTRVLIAFAGTTPKCMALE